MPTAREIGKAAITMAPKVAPGAARTLLRRILDIAIDGVSKVPSARSGAAASLQKNGTPAIAIEAIVRQHVALAGAQGFVTNLGGIASLPVMVPANVSGVAILQSRMVAEIAHLRGYDIGDSRVRTAIMMCLLGEAHVKELIDKGELPSTPLVLATAPVYDPSLDATVAEKVVANLMGQVGGKRMSLLVAERIPVLGGGVGLVADSWSTLNIARYARAQFVDRHVH